VIKTRESNYQKPALINDWFIEDNSIKNRFANFVSLTLIFQHVVIPTQHFAWFTPNIVPCGRWLTTCADAPATPVTFKVSEVETSDYVRTRNNKSKKRTLQVNKLRAFKLVNWARHLCEM
jgi:hypothetical protein